MFPITMKLSLVKNIGGYILDGPNYIHYVHSDKTCLFSVFMKWKLNRKWECAKTPCGTIVGLS